MPCCGRSRRSETDVQRTQRLLRNTLIGLLVLNVPHLLMGPMGLFAGLFFLILFMVAMRGLYRKNERALRSYVSLAVCGLCCVSAFFLVALIAAGGHRRPEVQGPEDSPQPLLEQKPAMMQQHDPTVLMATKEAPKQANDNQQAQQLEQPKPSQTQNEDEDQDDEDKRGRRHGKIVAAAVFGVALVEMLFFSLLVASVMLAARLARFLKAERLSAPAMMMPAKDLGDVALAPMASTGAPQVFYMPTADGQPQLVVYSPVPESA